MKTLEWLDFFDEQRAVHGKVSFSTPELANAARTSLHAVNTELGRLVNRGVIARYAQGRYGPPQGVAVENVLPALDSGAYATGFYVLFRRHLVTQAPSEITCFTDRRQNRKAVRATPAGKLRFFSVPPALYDKSPSEPFASPEQALCDFAWLNLRDGLHPRSLVTFQNLQTLNRRKLCTILRRYPEPVRKAVGEIVGFPNAAP